jgi:DNA-directed RNA polymerase specialized sigma subunit
LDNSNLAAGDPFAYAGQKRQADLEHISEVVRRTHTDLLRAIREEQARLGRHMTDSELDKFAREYHAEEYRQDLRRLMAMGAEKSDQDE